MKNIIKYIILTILTCAMMSCAADIAQTSSSAENVKTNEPGELSISLMIPDYYGLVSDSRAIAPNTAVIKMQYKSNSSWTDVNNTVDIGSAVKTKAEGLPSGVNLPYSQMTTSFSLPQGTYSVGDIRLLLCDSMGKTITSGTNTAAVTVASGKSSSATFYTVPSSTISKTSSTSLSQNQMVFAAVTMQAGSTYTVKLNTDRYPPVIVLFDNTGKFVKYYEPNNDQVTFTMTPTKTGSYYLGIWAKDNANSGFTVDVTCSAAILAEDFESGSFTTNGWTLGGTQPEIAVQGTNAAKLNADYHKTSSMSKTVNVTGECELSFMYYQQSTSGILTYIIDGTGYKLETSSRKWSTVVVPLTSDSHTIAFQSSNMYSSSFNSWYTSEKDTIYIDNIFIKPAAEQISTMERVTFDEEPDPNYWNLGSAAITDTDNSFASWTTPVSGAFPNSHGNVLATTFNNAVTIRRIKRTTDGVLQFWYKNSSVTVTTNGTQMTFPTSSQWKKALVPLSTGEHTITIKSGGRIDDVEIKDGSAFEITPRGVQQTYIGGHTIQYSLSPAAENVTWSVSGGSITSTGVFTPTTAGEFTVTAKNGNTTLAAATVKVHENNHEAFTIAGTTFNGVDSSTLSGNNITDTSITHFDTTQMPNKTTFSCDGFFPVVGTVTPSGSLNIALIRVSKDGYSTSYYLQGDFDQRIWLRFGPGEYKVQICDGAFSFRTAKDGKQGAIMGGSYSIKKTLTVTNTSQMTADDAMWLMPSHFINNDDYRIINVAADVLGGLSPSENTAADKLRALHDWETDFLYYDLSSISSYQSGTYRRHQEAIWVLQNTTAVCEGYATLYAALCRIIGIKAKYSRSDTLNHAYTFIWFDGDYRMTDVTWDDPISNLDTEETQNRNVGKYRYEYFLRSDNDGRDDTQYAPGRGEPVAPIAPDGDERGWF